MENKISTTLLYSNKSSCKDAAERVKVTSGINVHQLTMRHEHLYHQLLLYLDKDGLKELWKILFMSGSQDYGAAPSSPIGLHMGLLGIMFDRTVVWLNRAAALGKVTVSPLPSPMEAMKGEEGREGGRKGKEGGRERGRREGGREGRREEKGEREGGRQVGRNRSEEEGKGGK